VHFDEFLGDDPCNDATCQEIRRESEDQQNRLRAYLAARGLLSGGSTTRGLLIARSRADTDLRECRAAHNARCTHCRAAPLETTITCSQQCQATIPACVRLTRCEGGPFLQGVP
jgi:hypothetical protein